jgi:1-deoxy-D-xylulose-5-phosphate reductoisomerase
MTIPQLQRLCVLGATGSIGKSTLDVAARHPDRFEIFALTAHRQTDELFKLCQQHRPRFAALGDASQARLLRDRFRADGVATEVLGGPQALSDLAAHPDVSTVMAAVVGAAGLPSCLAAAKAGKRVLLANKEALVVGGALFMQAVQEAGAELIPIDSEHSAIFQCLPEDRRTWPDRIQHIVLTASGGPFRDRDPATLSAVTPEQACAHPNWVMGRKISVDSATMMNKALEVIEARWLFDLTPEQIQVVIHPQSVVHSMVVCKDQSVLAQLGSPDMRGPIAFGLAYPERIECGAQALNFSVASQMNFFPPDTQRYPGLPLAWEALRAPAGTTAVLNAANEEAVEAFLNRGLRFDQIHAVNAEALAKVSVSLQDAVTIDDLLALDDRARSFARGLIATLCSH